MPYVDPFVRKQFSFHRQQGHPAITRTGGELNYELTLVCLEHLHNNGERYETFNQIIGALEACKLEFYRRLVVPYEDKKKEENGDVY